MNKKITFLMPLYPTHYEYARNFLKSFNKFHFEKQADIWFVFSTQEDKELFPEATNYVIMPQVLKGLTRDEGVINAKKFYGLSKIKDKYEYIIVIDAESEIIKNINLYPLCERFFKNKKLWGAPCNEYTQFIDDACNLFFKDKVIDTKRLGFWFINMCIYKTSMLDDFFEKTKILDQLDSLNFWTFDYYVYMFYLLIYENFTPVCISLPPVETKGDLYRKDYVTNAMYMCTKEFLIQMKKLGLKANNCFMYIHLDRALIGQKYRSRLYKFFHFYWLRGK